MVSIVMTYFERSTQLRNTLLSFVEHGYGPDVEVIIVDDGSVAERAELPAFGYDFDIRIIYIEPAAKWYSNSCIPFNLGFAAARGDIVILQNAECLHLGNIVRHARANISESNYLSYACYSLDEATSKAIDIPGNRLQSISQLVNSDEAPTVDGGNGWYNHSAFRPAAYHFCAAILKANLLRLGGFDERYARGIGYDDNEILERIRNLPLEVRIVDEEIVVHQYHYSNRQIDDRFKELYHRNWVLFHFYTCGGCRKSDYAYFLAYIFSKQTLRNRFLTKVLKRINTRFKKSFTVA